MADIPFLGTFLLEDVTPATANYADNVTATTGEVQRNQIEIVTTLGQDHSFQIQGHSMVPFGFSMRGLTTAQKSALNTFHKNRTWLEVIYRPLAGALSATNPQETFHFQLSTAPTPPRDLTADYIWTHPDINVAYYQYTDGTTTVTYGQPQIT